VLLKELGTFQSKSTGPFLLGIIRVHLPILILDIILVNIVVEHLPFILL
jgi:hypothetical protein